MAALANGLWIGEVPEQLQNLTWAERTMIARVNHNHCVVRVEGSLQSKMIANAVCHTIPIPRYTMLCHQVLKNLMRYWPIYILGQLGQ